MSRPCELVFPMDLFLTSFHSVAVRRGLYYFVLSALDFQDFGEFKRFDGSIYRNLRELSLFILYVNEHDFESPWLYSLNLRMLTVATALF